MIEFKVGAGVCSEACFNFTSRLFIPSSTDDDLTISRHIHGLSLLHLAMTKAHGIPRCHLLELPVELRLLIYGYTQHTATLNSLMTAKNNHPILLSAQACPPRVTQIKIDGAPYVALIATCSTIRKEYLQFYHDLQAISLHFAFKQLYSHDTVDEFGTLGSYLDHFDQITDKLEMSLCNVSTLTLHLDCSMDTHPNSEYNPRSFREVLTPLPAQMSRLDNLLASFPRLQKLNIEVACWTRFYELYRRSGRSSQPISLLLDQSTAWRDRLPQLIIHETLMIYCAFAEIRSAYAGGQLPGCPRFAYFRAVPTTSPISWEGLDLEPIDFT